jgi:hypothetical protein
MESTARQVSGLQDAIPYVQVNFIVTLDADAACANLELTREFVSLCPAAWPNLNLATAFGRSAPLSRALAAQGRILDVPFPLLDTKSCWNLSCDAPAMATVLRELIALLEHVGSLEATARRLSAARSWRVRALNLLRSWGAEQQARLRDYRRLLAWTERDAGFRDFVTGSSPVVPRGLLDLALERLGPFRELLPRALAEHAHTGRRHEPLEEHLSAPAAIA